MLHSGTYTHSEHLEALRLSLGLDPLHSTALAILMRKSFGQSRDEVADACQTSGASVTAALVRARQHLCAPTNAGATYLAFAMGLLHDSKRLTANDLRVLRLMASGLTPPQIAKALDYKGGSIRSIGYKHVKSLREKLGAKTNAHAIRLGVRYGLLDPKAGDPWLPPWSQ